ncbi:hypothetical protein KSS87_002457, partial [Heliosperma pusillum]
MADDSLDSNRKHHRSQTDDESPEKSKRHKHRHHRRHHRRHRHHRSKHGEEKKDEIELEIKEDTGIVAKSGDYDMEEGEIVEELGVFVVNDDVVDNKVASDLESGELDDRDMRGVADMDSSPMDGDRKSGKILKLTSDRSGDSKDHRIHGSLDESPESVSIANGGRSHGRSKSPSKNSEKRKDEHRSESKDQLMEEDVDGQEGRRISYSHKSIDDRRSPSQGKHPVEKRVRSRSKSVDRMEERERSHSIVHERRSRSRHRREKDEGIYENGKVYDEYEEKDDYRLDRGERASDKRRERSSSRHRSSMHENGDYLDRQRDEMMYRDKTRVREQEPVRAKSDRDFENERDRRGKDRERESDRDKDNARNWKSGVDWDRESERDRERRREKDRGRSRDRDYERERMRDASTSSLRDRNLDRERDRQMETVRARDSHRVRDRHDDGSDRSRRYQDQANGYGDRDRRHGYDEPEYMRDRNRKYESLKDRVSKDVSVKENDDAKRDEEEDQKGYEERVDLKLAEQEEDDVDRIKEESRRRREAILQKYKEKQSQQPPQDSKDELLKEQPSQKHSEEPFGVDKLYNVGKSPLRNGTGAVESSTGAAGLGEGLPKSEQSDDMFCDDIFGDSSGGIRKMGKVDGLPVERSGLHDNWDDPEGYYSFRFGEILDSRYEVSAAHGKGVFSTVVRAKDLKAGSCDPEEVAIKIIRNNETMLKAGTEELVILKKLVGADPEDRRHCVRYLSHFTYRNHLCIVFESLDMNLREVLKKFGRNIGLNLAAVRTYAKQLFIALKHLRNCGVLHSDIKPDNMLVNESKTVLKLCDFGNAMLAGKNEITPYLVSRFYRAPEIILGLPYDHPMDIWSVGCCLYEFYTGKVLFPGATNNDMLRLHMELKGPFPKKMLRKGAFVEPHFDQDFNFLATEEDPVTKKAIRKLIFNIKAKDIGSVITGSQGDDPKMLTNFKDMMDKIFVLDPDKRLTVGGLKRLVIPGHLTASQWKLFISIDISSSLGRQSSNVYIRRGHPGEGTALKRGRAGKSQPRSMGWVRQAERAFTIVQPYVQDTLSTTPGSANEHTAIIHISKASEHCSAVYLKYWSLDRVVSAVYVKYWSLGSFMFLKCSLFHV